MNKNRNIIMEYLSQLNKEEKTFLLNNKDFIEKMMDKIGKKITKINNEKKILSDNNQKRKKYNNKATYSFSYEISQK